MGHRVVGNIISGFHRTSQCATGPHLWHLNIVIPGPLVHFPGRKKNNHLTCGNERTRDPGHA